MKLRNKLVAVLAASMVVTSVPVITMADTTNYVSTGRYAQKGTTYGFLSGNVAGYDVIYGQSGRGIGGSTADAGYDYTFSNGFEFVPQHDYDQKGSMFMSMTKDSPFNEKAVLTYVDAFNSSEGHSNIAFIGDVVVNANNPAWNNKKVEDLIRTGVTMYFNNTGNVGSAPSAFAGQPSRVSAATIRAKINEVFTAKKDASTKLYVDAVKAELDVDAIVDMLANKYANKTGLGNVTLSQAEISEVVKAVVDVANRANAAVTTQAQLYKAAPDGTQIINTTELENIVNATVKDVNAWIASESYTVPSCDETITIRKVDSFDVKDANDREYTSHLRVDFDGHFERGASYKVPLLCKLDGDKTVILNIDGRDSFVTSGKYNLTQDTLTDKRLTVTADGGAKLRTNYADAIGELRFTESQIKALTNGGKNRKIQITLPSSSDLEFNLSKTLAGAKAVGKRGFSKSDYTTENLKDGVEQSPNIEFLSESGYVNNSSAYVNALAQRLATTENNVQKLRISYGITSRRNSYTDIDKQTLIIELPYFKDDLAVGEIALSGIYVQPKDGKATAGDIKVTVEEYIAPAWSNTVTTNQNYVEAPFDSNGNYYHNNTQFYVLTRNDGYQPYTYDSRQTVNRSNTPLYVLTNGSTVVSSAAQASTNLVASKEVKVGEVREYDVQLKCDKPADIKAGRSGVLNKKTVEFVLEEMVKDSLVDNRKIEFKLENGYMFGPADIDYTDTAANANGAIATGLYGSANYKQKAIQKFKDLVADKTIEFKEKAEAGTDDGIKHEGFVMSTLELVMDSEGRVIGFSGEYDRLKSSADDKIKVKVPVATDVMNKGEVKVVASNIYTRSFQDKQEDPSCVIANIKAPIDVTFDGAKLKVGQQAQEAGTITIKETEQGMLEKGWLFLAAKDQAGITFDSVPTVKVADAEGKQLTVKNVELSKDKTMVGIEITKSSSVASTITVEGINLTADRTVPQANYDLAIWGTALTDENELGITNFTQNALYSHSYFNQASDLYVVKDFIQMTTANTEDLSGAAKAVTTQFVIGQKKFTVNGESTDMDVAPYIKDGLTFVPVKYLAQAFGIEGNAVQYDKATSTVTIVYGDKAIKMTNGKAVMTVNGTEVPMASKAEIGKEGRMCVPMAYIASALGVDKSWDAATKTATFSNVRK